MLECHRIICVNVCTYQRISLSFKYTCVLASAWRIRGKSQAGLSALLLSVVKLAACVLLLFLVERGEQLEDVLCRKHAEACTRKKKKAFVELIVTASVPYTARQPKGTKDIGSRACMHALPLLYCLRSFLSCRFKKKYNLVCYTAELRR